MATYYPPGAQEVYDPISQRKIGPHDQFMGELVVSTQEIRNPMTGKIKTTITTEKGTVVEMDGEYSPHSKILSINRPCTAQEANENLEKAVEKSSRIMWMNSTGNTIDWSQAVDTQVKPDWKVLEWDLGWVKNKKRFRGRI